MKILIAGCGAIGSQLALHLSRLDVEFILLDDDKVSEDNVGNGTSVFVRHQIGRHKVSALSEMMWERNEEGKCRPIVRRLTESNLAKTARYTTDLIVDCFDNAESRNLLHNVGVPTLHVGVSDDRTGAITWDEHWTPAVSIDEENEICTHDLGAPILRLTAAIAARVVEWYLEDGNKVSLVVTENLEICR